MFCACETIHYYSVVLHVVRARHMFDCRPVENEVPNKWRLVCLRDNIFLKSHIAQTVYTACTGINCKIVPVTSFNKYLHYGTVQVELNYMYINNR